MVVPVNARSKLCRREFVRSLETSDPKEAAIRARPILAAWQLEIEFARKGAGVNGANTPIAAAIYRKYFEKFGVALMEKYREASDKKAFIDQRKSDAEKFRREFHAEDFSNWEDYLDNIIEEEGYTGVQPTDRLRYLSLLADATIEQLGIFLKRLDGDHDLEPRSSRILAAQTSSRTSQAQATGDGEDLKALFEKYVVSRIEEGKRPDALKQERLVLELLVEVVGVTRTPGGVSSKDARDFADLLAKFPSGRGKNNELRLLSPIACVSLAENKSLKVLSVTTQNRYISNLNAFYSWLIVRNYVEINPFARFRRKNHLIKGARPSYSAQQLTTIFQSPLFTEAAARQKTNSPNNADSWQIWVPLLCLFTGARTSEIAQLYTDDITEREDTLVVELHHNPVRGQFIKNKRDRFITIHPKLMKLGFAQFWKQRFVETGRDGGQLFAGLSPDSRDLLGSRPSKFWLRYLLKIGLKTTGSDGLGMHSFRHTVADELRKTGLSDAEFGQLVLGHSNNSVTSRYGAMHQGTFVKVRGMIDAMKFEGVIFPSPLA